MFDSENSGNAILHHKRFTKFAPDIKKPDAAGNNWKIEYGWIALTAF